MGFSLGRFPVSVLGGGRVVSPYDPDAANWFAAVEATGATFGPNAGAITANKLLINDQIFVGCKADASPIAGVSNWAALKVFGLNLAASTLAGALVPIKGAPTFLNYVAGDYSRLTGLLGNLTDRGINSNRAQNADPQNNYGSFAYLTVAGTAVVAERYIGANSADNGRSIFIADGRVACRSALLTPSPTLGSSTSTGLVGLSRHQAASFVARRGGASQTITATSSAATAGNTTFMFDPITPGTNMNGRSAAFGAGESLDLAALDARIAAVVAGLM